jgi:predicted GIY-YIG superfamily endonuclease
MKYRNAPGEGQKCRRERPLHAMVVRRRESDRYSALKTNKLLKNQRRSKRGKLPIRGSQVRGKYTGFRNFSVASGALPEP